MIMIIIIICFIIIIISQYIHVLLTVYVGFNKKLVKIDINKNNTGKWYKCQRDRFYIHNKNGPTI